jgi:curved DNA-binding protein CbpA
MEAAKARAAKASDPYVTLHLLPSAPPEVVKAAYKALAVLNHPDKGGETEVMQRINDAYRRLAA